MYQVIPDDLTLNTRNAMIAEVRSRPRHTPDNASTDRRHQAENGAEGRKRCAGLALSIHSGDIPAGASTIVPFGENVSNSSWT
jgi:hypothetical protein